MHDFEFLVSEYLGTLENGVLVVISIIYKKNYFEGTFFYTDKDVVFTINEALELIIGDVKNHPNYLDMIKTLIRITVPYDQMYHTLDPVSFSKWAKKTAEIEGLDDPMVMDGSDS